MSDSIRKDPKDLCNPRGRSGVSEEVLAAETLEISGSGILLSELWIEAQSQILGALNKKLPTSCLTCVHSTERKGNVYKSHLYISQNSDSYPVKSDELPCAQLPKILLTEP